MDKIIIRNTASNPECTKSVNMAIFKTRVAAEQFAKEDPFILEGLVKSFTIRDWNDNLIPE